MVKPRSQGSRELAGPRLGQRRVQRFCSEREQNTFKGRGDLFKNWEGRGGMEYVEICYTYFIS